jgi:putative membrane protein
MLPRPSRILDVGEEPDPRFTLANERTFLAWNRTALALIGGGLAIGQLVDFSSTAARLVASLAPVAVGVLLALVSLRRWVSVERALRLGQPLPVASTVLVLALGVGIVAVAVAVAVVLDATGA